jgi:transcriptional regulator with XRE-family HTH domain
LEPDKDYNLTVGLRIREIREAFQLTRAEFSEKCDISDSFLAAVESGRKSITSKTLYKICTAMDISADYIIRGKSMGFESDTLIELIGNMDRRPRESAIRILREYTYIVNLLSNKNDTM